MDIMRVKDVGLLRKGPIDRSAWLRGGDEGTVAEIALIETART